MTTRRSIALRGAAEAMTRERLYLFDTTLRDGAQTTGVDFSLEDKRAVATLLDRLGLDYVEGGYPGANPLDTSFFAEKRTKNAKFTAFGMTKRAGRSAANDPGIAALLDADADAICFVAKASGLPRPRRARDDAAGEPRRHPRLGRGGARARPRGHRRLRAFLRRLQGRSGPTRSPAPARRTRPARAGSSCATPMAARCRTRSSASSAT